VEYKWNVLVVTSVGVLMAGLDSRIMIVGLPQIATAARVSSGDIAPGMGFAGNRPSLGLILRSLGRILPITIGRVASEPPGARIPPYFTSAP
jgi:hypothetical protein